MVLHLLTTTKCDRNCKYCCNRQYDLKELPTATEKDFEVVDEVCITGGEPIIYSPVSKIAKQLKERYENIKKVYCYCNAKELLIALNFSTSLDGLDGLSISIKNDDDVSAFYELTRYFYYILNKLNSNYVYVFDNLIKREEIPENWVYIKREWQEDFKPAPNCIFKKMEAGFVKEVVKSYCLNHPYSIYERRKDIAQDNTFHFSYQVAFEEISKDMANKTDAQIANWLYEKYKDTNVSTVYVLNQEQFKNFLLTMLPKYMGK